MTDYRKMSSAQYAEWLKAGGTRSPVVIEGTAVEVDRSLTVPHPPLLTMTKAVTGAGVTAYATDYPLTSLMQEPQARAAAYLRAYKCGWFYKAESKISGDLATLPWTVHDGDIDSADDRETTIDRPDLDIPFERLNPIQQFMRLMERPNPNQTGRQLRQKTHIRRDMAGVAFWYLEAASERSPITAIYGISPSRLWPAYDKGGQLIGYVLDKNSSSGGTPFEAWEIVPFSNASADDDDIFGVGVVEAVYAELPLTDLMSRHTADLLTTGGRLAGMLWPKDRALNEDEFTDAQRAWRNVVSDPASAKRLLLFPEPMEWAAGASTPAEIGIPELANLNRDNILTSFPIGPEMLGVPTAGGLNASGETRRELYDFYQRETLQPRTLSYDEVIQTSIISRYEALMGQTFRYETELPNLDDASSLLEKAGAFRSLVAIGFDPRDTIKAVGLDHIKWTQLPKQLDPNKEPEPTLLPDKGPPQTNAAVSDDTAGNSTVTQVVSKATKSREAIAEGNDPRIRAFLEQQRDRVVTNIGATLPATGKSDRTKALRLDWAVKADPEWWDAKREDQLLREALSTLYVQAARGSLQVVADAVDGIIPNRAVGRIADDLMSHGATRITDINAHTLSEIQSALSEGTRRGYSLDQLINGVPDEGYRGIKELTVFDDARAEVIARTETMLSYNRAALDAYGEFGVTEVLAYDGDEDAECAARDGQTFTIEEALAIEDHPNGTLDWAPVTDKAYHPEFDPEAFKSAIIEAVSARPTTINNYIEPAQTHMDAPIVHVNTPDVNVAPPNVTLNVPEQPAPVVNVKVPERSVTVEAPPPAEITVNVPHQPAPVVNLTPAPITVTTPEVVVNMPERKPLKKVLDRDKKGRVTGMTESEA